MKLQNLEEIKKRVIYYLLTNNKLPLNSIECLKQISCDAKQTDRK
mgnify:CR=1 FL=1